MIVVGGESADFQHTVIGRATLAWEMANYTQISECVKTGTVLVGATERVRDLFQFFFFSISYL